MGWEKNSIWGAIPPPHKTKRIDFPIHEARDAVCFSLEGKHREPLVTGGVLHGCSLEIHVRALSRSLEPRLEIRKYASHLKNSIEVIY